MKRTGWLLSILLVLYVAKLWLTDSVSTNNLLYSVDWKYPQAFLETKNLYLYIHLFVFVPVFLLSFDRRVAYYKKWKALWLAIILIAIPFIIWDVFFTQKGVWGFNENYITGIHLFNLPIEECLFFLTVPFASIFIHECLSYYFPKDIFKKWDKQITYGLILICLVIGIYYNTHIYTATTFLLTSACLVLHVSFIKNTYRTQFYKAYVLIFIPFCMVNGILTGGYTQNPVVVYNPEEYIGFRLTSVPVDDIAYGFLLLFLIVSVYERLLKAEKVDD